MLTTPTFLSKPCRSPGVPTARSTRPSALKSPAASARPKCSFFAGAPPASPWFSCCAPVLWRPPDAPYMTLTTPAPGDGGRADVLVRRSHREVGYAVAVEVGAHGRAGHPGRDR